MAVHTSTEPSLGDLVGRATHDVSVLVRKEVELAKAEAATAGKGAGLVGGAGVAGLYALGFLSLALMFALGAAMPLGWAAAIVGGGYLVVAAVLALVGRHAFKEVGTWARHPRS